MADGSEGNSQPGAELAAPDQDRGAVKKDDFLIDGERAVDVILGAAVVAAEAIAQAAKHLQENGPAYVETLETKGRPVRERLVEALRVGRPATFRDVTFSPPASAEDEISALERRVRELEQQIASGNATETPAEEATYVPAESWGDDVPSLAESPYAISETEEERAQEGKIGEEPGRGEAP
jgi:hypothetical protein